MELIQNIYKAILANRFTAKGQDKVNNKRLGIKRTFRDARGRYIEIYPETFGYSIHIYGPGFSRGYFPHRAHIIDKKDIDHLRTLMNKIIKKL